MKDALTKETVIRTNLATILAFVGGIIAITGAWTTLMLRVGSVENANHKQDVIIEDIKDDVQFNRETFLQIQGDLKEIKASL